MNFLKPLYPLFAVMLADWCGWLGWLAHEVLGWFAANREAMQGFSYLAAGICSICVGVHQFKKRKKKKDPYD